MSKLDNPKKAKKILGLFLSLSNNDQKAMLMRLGKISNSGNNEMQIEA